MENMGYGGPYDSKRGYGQSQGRYPLEELDADNAIKVLDLFCCGGGASMGYYNAGATEVVGIDTNPSKDYPFTLEKMDWQEGLEKWNSWADLIHASPPCQHYAPRSIPENHPDLLPAVFSALEKTGKPFVIENVMTAKMPTSLILCGSMFNLRTDVPAWDSQNVWRTGLQLRRHRRFFTNFTVEAPGACAHREASITMYGNNKLTDAHRQCMGMPWVTEWRSVKEAIPPAYTEHILNEYLGRGSKQLRQGIGNGSLTY